MAIVRPDGRIHRTAITEEERVLSGVLRYVRESANNGTNLDGELKLADLLSCTRQQVRQALAQLERQGIVTRRQGAATTVDPVALQLSARFDALTEYGEVLALMGYSPSVEVLDAQLVPMPTKIAPLLVDDADDTVARIRLRWYADDDPIMYAEYTIALPAGTNDPHIDAGTTVFDIVREQWGEPVSWEIVTAGVDELTTKQAVPLHLEAGGISKMWQVVGVTSSGRRVYHSLQHHHPDRVLYSFVRTIREPWSVPAR